MPDEIRPYQINVEHILEEFSRLKLESRLPGRPKFIYEFCEKFAKHVGLLAASGLLTPQLASTVVLFLLGQYAKLSRVHRGTVTNAAAIIWLDIEDIFHTYATDLGWSIELLHLLRTDPNFDEYRRTSKNLPRVH